MRKLGSFLVILVTIFTVSPVGASDPTITGKIFGHEVCAQFHLHVRRVRRGLSGKDRRQGRREGQVLG
jgi:hypothetical protein